MKRGFFALIALTVGLVVAYGPAPQAEAQGPPWMTAGWVNGGVAATVTPSGVGTFQITDFQCVGDNYTLTGSINIDVVGGPQDACPTELSPDAAFASPHFASGQYCLSAGDHSITITHRDGYDVGDVAFRFIPGPCLADAQRISVTAHCIESEVIQNNARVQQGRGGQTFPQAGANPGHISYGPPTCSYNCIDGFDLNCDGKIGDFCPTEYDRLLVKNVQPCLAASQPDAPATPAAPEAVVEAVVEAVPAAEPVTALAHTGPEDALGFVGSALVAFGSAFVALSHRSRGTRPRRR